MTSVPVTVLNSLANLDEATAYFADSVRAASWDGIDPDSQSRYLITATRLLDRQRWEGALSGLQIVRTAVVAAGGTGYAVGSILTVSGGTTVDPARAKVTAVSAGVVTAVQLVDSGGYTANPAGTAATSSSAGGTGCTLTLTMGAQLLQLPRSGMTDRYGATVDSGLVPPEITQACLELALELVLDPTLEGQGSTASTARKRVKAGSAEVENFAPGAFVPIERFPSSVMELIKPFLLGSGDAVSQIGAAFASGTDAESAFDDCDGSNLTEGFG